MSLAASATTPTAFASLEDTGAVTLWDTRLKRKDYMCVGEGAAKMKGAEATDLLLVADRQTAVVLAERTVIMYDLRQQALLHSHENPCETVAFLSGTHPRGSTTTLIADENGAIIPFDLQKCAPTTHLSERYFGTEKCLPTPSFGSLSNYCCGLGTLRRDGVHTLCALGMDGNGAFYTDPLSAPTSFCMMDDMTLSGGQIVNPPLPTTCSFMDGFVAVGRANGLYSVATLDDDASTVVEVFAAPGHAANGLCVVAWTMSGHLVTCSLCGEVSSWNLLPLLEQEPSADETEGDLPPLDMACSVRETTKQRSIVNCGVVLDSGLFVAADTLGFVTSCAIALT